jgi:hypothetical protein
LRAGPPRRPPKPSSGEGDWTGPTAAALIGVCAAYQIMLGGYFAVIRPALLPEDLRFLRATAGELAALLPRLERWLDLVFVVLGGQMAALGILVAGFAYRLGRGTSLSGCDLVFLGLAGTASVGLMGAVNFALRSDFRWLLVIPIVAWSIGIALAAATGVSWRRRQEEEGRNGR